MNRPLITAAVCLAAASVIGTQTTLFRDIWPAVWLIIIAAAILVSAFFPFLAKVRPYIILLAAACLFVTAYQRIFVSPVEALIRENTLSVRATVLDYPDEYEDTQRVPLRITAAGETAPGERKLRAFKTLCYLPLTPSQLTPGDTLETRVTFYQPDRRDGFERASYYAANGYFVLASQEDGAPIRCTRGAPVWWSYPLRLAQTLKASVEAQLPKRESALLNAILFGDRSGLSSADERSLRRAGLSHMVAVSGMHVGFLTMLVCRLFSRKYGMILSVFVILFFIPMAGASPSVIRAAIMYILMAIAFQFCLDSDSLIFISFALLVLLVSNPYSIGSTSLLLSFGATLGLLLFSERLHRLLMQPAQQLPKRRKKLLSTLASALSCSLCAMIFTTPILLASFGYITVLSPFTNLLTISVMGAVFALGTLLAFAGLCCPWLCGPLAAVETILLDYILNISEWTAQLPFGLLSWGDLLGKTAIFCFYAGLLLLYILQQKRHAYLVLPPLLMVLTLSSVFSMRSTRESTRLSILPSGSGQTLVYSKGTEELTVIDCGGDKGHNMAESVTEFLEWNGYTEIDTLILTAVDMAHARNAAALLETGLVNSLVLPEIPESRQKELYHNLLAAAEKNTVPYSIGIPDILPQNINLWDDIPRKFVTCVTIGGREVLVVHSLTQNMLAEFLEGTPQQTDILLLSEGGITDADQLRDALEILQPEEIVLECGYVDNESLLRRPCHNTKLEGEIVLTEAKGGGVEWR